MKLTSKVDRLQHDTNEEKMELSIEFKKFAILIIGYIILDIVFKIKLFSIEWIFSTLAMTMAYFAGKLK